MLESDEINTTLLVVLVLMVIFLIVIYFTVNYNQTQKANILNEKANYLNQKVSNLKMDCPRCPSLECPPEKGCPACNCPQAPKCPSCPPQEKCPDLKCPDMNVTKNDGKIDSIKCPDVKCPDVKCPDVKCPKCSDNNQPVITTPPESELLSDPSPNIVSMPPPLRTTINNPPKGMIPPQPKPPVKPVKPPEPIIDDNIRSTEYRPPRMFGDPLELNPIDLLPKGGKPVFDQSPYASIDLNYFQPPAYLDQVIGGINSGVVRTVDESITSGGHYPVKGVIEKCPIQGYKGLNQAPMSDTPSRPSRKHPHPTSNVVASNVRPKPTPPEATPPEPTPPESNPSEKELESDTIQSNENISENIIEENSSDEMIEEIYEDDYIEGYINYMQATGAGWY